jgi:hypothetical protein
VLGSPELLAGVSVDFVHPLAINNKAVNKQAQAEFQPDRTRKKPENMDFIRIFL